MLAMVVICIGGVVSKKWEFVANLVVIHTEVTVATLQNGLASALKGMGLYLNFYRRPRLRYVATNVRRR